MRPTQFHKSLILALAIAIGCFTLITPALAGIRDSLGEPMPRDMGNARVVSLAPNITEILYFLGHGSLLVGRTDYCNYPPEALELPSVGGFADTNLERVILLEPDLVFAYQGNDRDLVNQIKAAGIKVVALREATNLMEIMAQMASINSCFATDRDDPGAKAVTDWYERLQREKWPATRLEGPPKVFFGYPDELVYTCGPDSYLTDLIEQAGGINVKGYLGHDKWPQVSAEWIIANEPNFLLVAGSHGGDCPFTTSEKMLSDLRNDPVWRDLPAVKRGNILVIDADILLRPGPRILDALVIMRKAFHPEYEPGLEEQTPEHNPETVEAVHP